MDKIKKIMGCAVVIGYVLLLSSCGNKNNSIENTEKESFSVQEYDETKTEALSEPMTDGEETESSSTTTSANNWMEQGVTEQGEIVNIEEADITHDGIPDRIVTYKKSLTSNDKKSDSQEGRQVGEYTYTICIYDGTMLDQELTPEACIWERRYLDPYNENEQLYLTERDGESYFIRNRNSIIQDTAIYQYQVFYLQNGEENVEAEDSFAFRTFSDSKNGAPDFEVETAVAYTEGLEKQLKDSTLLIYCGVEQDTRIRMTGKPCTARAEEIWGWTMEYIEEKQELTMDNLRDILNAYYEKGWRKN